MADCLVDGANDHLGRLVVVADGAALAQELRVHGDRHRPAGGALQLGKQYLAGGPGQDGAADHDDDGRPPGAGCLPDVPATRRRYVRSRLPLSRLGVPTHTNASSVSATAAA